jgi:hypothetical protein
MMNYHGCNMTLEEQNPTDNPELIFGNDTSEQLLNVGGASGLLDARYLLSPNSDFIVGAQGNALELPLATSQKFTTALSDIGADIAAHTSLITNYLLQTDFFNGKPNPKSQTLHTISNQSYLKSSNIDLDAFRVEAQDILSNNGSTNPTAPTEAQKNISPAELDFAINGLQGKLNPRDLPVIAAKYGFIHKVQALHGYKIDNQPGAVDVLIGAPKWKDMTQDTVDRVISGVPYLCRLVKHETILANFKGLKAPNYNIYFILKPNSIDSILSAPNTVGNPVVPPTPLPPAVVNSFTSEQMEVSDYTSTPDPSAPPPLPPSHNYPNYDPHAHLKQHQNIPLEGATTRDLNHRHKYIIDAEGNGIAKEDCHPGYPNICHTHVIEKYKILPGNSKMIDEVNGLPDHIHKIKTNGETTNGPDSPTNNQTNGGGGPTDY